MLFRVQFIVALIAFSAIMTILQGCASGVRILGEVSIAEGLTRRYIQIGSEGHDSARLTVIESFDIRTDAAGNIHVKQANDPIVATTDGLIGKVVQGTGAAAMAAGGQLGAAALRRPDLYNSTTVQTGGGADVATSTSTEQSATSEGSEALALGVGKGGAGGAGGVSSSSSSSNQTQDQEQSLSDGNINVTSSPSVSNTVTNTASGGTGGAGGSGGSGGNTTTTQVDVCGRNNQIQSQQIAGDGNKRNDFRSNRQDIEED